VIARVVAWCTHRHWLVIALALVLAVLGESGRRALSRDAIPDLSDPQIVLVADWMGHPTLEVASKVTKVLTAALQDIPGVTAVRGASMSGMAYVDIIFESSRDLKRGRQAILERVPTLSSELPENVRLQVGPAATSTGWVFQYVLVDRTHREALSALRRVQDTVLAPALGSIAGVAEVASVGGDVQQVLVEVKPDQLRTRALAFTDVVAALRPKAHGPMLPQRGRHGTLTVKELESVPLKGAPAQNGASVPLIADVAHLRITRDMPTGMADLNGVLPAVGGIVVASRDADPAAVVENVKRTLDELRPKLPDSVQLITVYDRLDLVDRVSQTLERALSEEVAVVVLVVLMFLLHVRSALVPLVTLPFVLLLTFGGMWLLGVSATIMSLGGIGIALGMAVDADVVALEACHRRLERLGKSPSATERRKAVIGAAGSFAPAILTALVITALSFLPVFAFTGESGRLLRPLAITKTLVIVSAALVALTLAPALRYRLLSGRVKPEFENPITRGLVRMYRPFVHFALRRPALTLVTATLAVISCVPIVSRLGAEFLPRLDEGDLLSMPTTLPGIPPGETAVQLRRHDRAISQFKEVSTVFGKVGRATTATDPAPYSMIETTIRLLPRSEWPKQQRQRWYSSWAPRGVKPLLGFLWPERTPRTTAELVDELDQATRLPGWTNAWTAPARARMDMMSTGVHTPVGIRIVAANPERLDALGGALQKITSHLPGTRSAVFESLGGEPWPEFVADPVLLARHAVDPELVESTADLLLTGGQVGELEWGGEPYRVRIMPDEEEMDMSHGAVVDQLRDVTVRSSANGSGQPVPFALLGKSSFVNKPAMIRSEGGELVAYVYVDLKDGADVQSYLRDAQHEIDQAQSGGSLQLEPGERIEWTGQYELLAEGEQRLKWIVPLVALSMFVLLFLQFKSLTEALIVLVSVPFALVGSFWTLYFLDYPLSAPVWVGLLSAVGLAMQTGVVMVVYIDDAFHRRVREGKLRTRDDIIAAHAEGTVQRLRPKIMTITTMGAGLLPLVWAEGAGAEIMRRVAAPMLGGLVTSAFLTLEVLPVLYTLWRTHQLRRAQRTGRPLEAIVGAVPAWAQR
jgi:Cu(I)/Ag(I) efflux system membrane protein CusA/SilA